MIPVTEVIVFSDGLDVQKCIDLKEACDQAEIGCSFGVGTTFTNDFVRVEGTSKDDISGAGPPRTGEKSKALNM